MFSEILTLVLLSWSSIEDWKTATVGNYIWIFGIPLVLVAGALEYGLGGSLSLILFGLWFWTTGFLIAYFTELGGADIWAFSLVGMGATTFQLGVVAAVTIPVLFTYAYWLHRKDVEIRLIPGIALSYFITFILHALVI